MATWAAEALDEVVLAGAGAKTLAGMDLMSPFAWREDDRYRLLVRAVPSPLGPGEPKGVIWGGAGADGLRFETEAAPAIAPGPGADDAGGCEDPTVVVTGAGDAVSAGVDGGPAPDGGARGYQVYYTGVDAARSQGCMMFADGPALTRLQKRRLVLKAPPGEGNIKEASPARAADGTWRLFYEYAADNASRVGMATGPTEQGPWTVVDDPFGVRDGSWDDWHLSTGPVVRVAGTDEPVMFYNGATRDARWRIGWISFDPLFGRVTGRGLEPLILPPPPTDRAATDIAFAASAIATGGAEAWLYYSLEDRLLRRATVRRYV